MTHTLSDLLEDIDARDLFTSPKRAKKRILGSINPSV